MSGLLIATPLRIEAEIVRSGVARAAGICKTGMGPERARVAAQALARAPGRALLVLGFCGGLDAESVPGETIVAEAVLTASDEGHPPKRVPCADVEGLIGSLHARGMTARRGDIVCVSRLALGPRRAQLLAGGALAVDMESVWLASGAAGRPFGVVRVVLDSPTYELLRPRALGGALRAARALRAVAGALQDWTPISSAAQVADSSPIGDRGPGGRGLHGGSQGD